MSLYKSKRAKLPVKTAAVAGSAGPEKAADSKRVAAPGSFAVVRLAVPVAAAG